MKKLSILLTVLFLFSSWRVASASPINVANLYGTATANSYYSSRTPDLAIDNVCNTHWDAGDHGTASNPNWLVVDLETSYDVNTIDLFFSPLDGLYAGYTNNYNVYCRDDNVSSWNFVGSGQFVDEDTSQITDHFDFGSAGQSMRYVKYEVNGGTHWSGISEIYIWADDGTGGGGEGVPGCPVPLPATVLLFGMGLVGLLGFKTRKER